MKYSEISKRLTGINVYITNIAWEIVSKERVHDLYSLRWQVEIVFKTWKSFFQIHLCGGKRIQGFLYDSNLFSFVHQVIEENTQAYTKILLRLFHLLQKNGRKSHRYKKKTVFDILGVVYEYTIYIAKVA
ncbi:transposase [Paenibacillus sp. WST5]|uniref:Transposase n=1 Tax=Paenibacillus sedimenti TaxID=2770274 RepID=A0A926QKI3_9BACL|nr:transposase [Paenibacillus sedimenti]